MNTDKANDFLHLLQSARVISSSMDINEILNVFANELINTFAFDGILFQIYDKKEEIINHYGYYYREKIIPPDAFEKEYSLLGNENNLISSLSEKGDMIFPADLPYFLKNRFEKHPFSGISYQDEITNEIKQVSLFPVLTVPIPYKDEKIILIFFLSTKKVFNLNQNEIEALTNFIGTFKSSIRHTEIYELLKLDVEKLKEENLQKEMQITGFKEVIDTYENILTVSSLELLEAQNTISAMQVVEEMSRKELIDVKQSMDSYKEILTDKKKSKKKFILKPSVASFRKWATIFVHKKVTDKKFILGVSQILLTLIVLIFLILQMLNFAQVASSKIDIIEPPIAGSISKLALNFFRTRKVFENSTDSYENLLSNPVFDILNDETAVANGSSTGGQSGQRQSLRTVVPNGDHNLTQNSRVYGHGVSGARYAIPLPRRTSPGENQGDSLSEVERLSVDPSEDTLILKGFGQLPEGWGIILSVNDKDSFLKSGQVLNGYSIKSLDINNNFALLEKQNQVIKLSLNKPVKVTR